jgi:Leucine-rich repeat (LRR) protein
MTGEGLAFVPAPQRLKTLFLAYVDDSGMKTISRFPNLRKLYIGGGITAKECPVSDDALKYLCGLASLASLSVSLSKIDDTSAPYLASLSSLQSLDISSTVTVLPEMVSSGRFR